MTPAEVTLIVGGGPAALAAARAFRTHGGGGPVTIVSDEEHRPYRRPPLSKEYLRGQSAREHLFLESEDWFRRHGIELRRGRAVALDPARRVVRAEDGTEQRYARCLIATGAEPLRPAVPGAEAGMVLRTVEDADRLAGRVWPGARVVVVGSGFIGCEAAASLALTGARVTQVGLESLPQEGRLGEEAGRLIRGWLQEAGVRTVGGAELAAIVPGRGAAHEVRLDGAEPLLADVVLLATGVRPRGALAGAAGLRTRDDAVCVDASMRASADGVLAAGDVSFAHNAAAGRPVRVEHWGEALNQGAVAGAAMAGARERWTSVPGFWSTIGFRTLKYAAWGDGWDEARLDAVAGHEGFTVWYARDRVLVGVLSHLRDAHYELGRWRIERGMAPP